MSGDPVKSPRSILYVDDEPANLVVFEAAFEDEYDLYVAASGHEALEILRERPIHVLITDMRMPRMDGVELLRRVIPDYPDVIRIVLTGYTDVNSVVKAVNEGKVYQFITKPWQVEEVRVIIDRALQHAEARQRERGLLARLDDQTRQEESIRTVFQRYAPSPVVEMVLENEAWVEETAAEQCEVTLLLCDLREFTPLCQDNPPDRVLALLNEYFDLMTSIVERRGGMMNQFFGDAFLAFFGAPIALVEHEAAAVRAGLEMLAAIEEFNTGRALELIGSPLRIGVGIQRGIAAVGNVGSANKMVYTVVGDPLSEVAEVEACCKHSPNVVVITDDVRQRVEGRFELSPFDEIHFGGADRSVPLFRVLGPVSAS